MIKLFEKFTEKEYLEDKKELQKELIQRLGEKHIYKIIDDCVKNILTEPLKKTFKHLIKSHNYNI
jgi:hypothetical protein